ncbi:hypothetical protein KX729_18765 [Rhizobium sp. XQZ8]|uniref:hypothetical protein n=1 Tax=Rhizobium populisoli TaxID=2859785 RepID=UPI001CA4A25D|nr:hypothetical protein [Rhizobium populisoli]MBW6423503.1 hypothetical protein [Rhizobium populisoli]
MLHAQILEIGERGFAEDVVAAALQGAGADGQCVGGVLGGDKLGYVAAALVAAALIVSEITARKIAAVGRMSRRHPARAIRITRSAGSSRSP